MPKAGRHFNTVTKLLLVIVCRLVVCRFPIFHMKTALFQFVASYNLQQCGSGRRTSLDLIWSTKLFKPGTTPSGSSHPQAAVDPKLVS